MDDVTEVGRILNDVKLQVSTAQNIFGFSNATEIVG
jgi:hypothetical protein